MTPWEIEIPLYEKNNKYYFILNDHDCMEITSHRISKGCLILYLEEYEEIKDEVIIHLKTLPTFDCQEYINWHGIILEQHGCYNRTIYHLTCLQLNL